VAAAAARGTVVLLVSTADEDRLIAAGETDFRRK